jgi:hypothetical protein
MYLRWCRARLRYEHVRGGPSTRSPRVRHESDGNDAAHVANGAFQRVWWHDREDDAVLMGEAPVISANVQCSNGWRGEKEMMTNFDPEPPSFESADGHI